MTTDPEVADELVATIRDWIRKDVIPTASEFEHADRYPEAWVAQMRAFGLFGARIDPEFGGLGLDTVTYARLMDELAYGWMSLSGVINTHTIAATLISKFGTDAQRERLLPILAEGDRRAAFSLSEPDAGSDTQAIRCRAARDGDEYVLNGTKMWVTNGERASIVALAAKTDEGITCFIVEKEPGPTSGGITVSKNIDKLGFRSSDTVGLMLKDVRVPAENLLGELHHGFIQAMELLDAGRIGVAAMAVGIGRGCLEESLAYARKRQAFGHPIADFQAIEWMLADMATELDAARLLVYRAAKLKDVGTRFSREASMAKLFASEAAVRAALKAVQVHGGYGYTRAFPVERYLREAKLCELGEGTSEMQRLVIARDILKES